jgi:hypothetical protein
MPSEPWQHPEHYAALWADDTGKPRDDQEWQAAYERNLSDLRAEAGRRGIDDALQRQAASAAWNAPGSPQGQPGPPAPEPGEAAGQMAAIQALHVQAAGHMAAGRGEEALAAAMELDRIRHAMMAAGTYSRDWEFPEEAARREEFYRQHGTPFHRTIYPVAKGYFQEEHSLDIDELGADRW